MTESVRERDERDARFFAWDVPGDAHVVALVHEADEAERSATVADAIATSVARRREHTLLLSAEAGPSPLDELLGASASKGLPAALEGRARLTDVAVQRVDRPFVYLPGGEDATAMTALLQDQVLTSFVERVRERGGTLFIVLSDETLRLDPLRALIDGYVALGEVDLPEAAADLVQFGRVRFDNGDELTSQDANGGGPRVADVPGLPPLPEAEAPAPEAPEPELSAPEPTFAIEAEGVVAEETVASPAEPAPPAPAPAPVAPPESMEPAAGETTPVSEAVDTPDGHEVQDQAWQRHRKPPGFPTAKVVIGAVAILAAGATWWGVAGGFGGAEPGAASDAEAAATTRASATSGGAPPAAPAFDEAAARSAFEVASPLGYSVMIASFSARADADDRLNELRQAGLGFYFVSPTPVRGVLYHRVFAGALGSRAEAQSLMDALVETGVKSEAGAWHLRPSTLAFDLGVYPDRSAADRRVTDLEGRGVPAYALSAAGEDGTVWRVYGGAYVDERESVPMSELLTEAGEPADLIQRRGVVP
jgi:septal ring-binding cell division protein DamX